MTYKEFIELVDAYQYRQDIEMQRLAWQTANLMNVHLKKKITVRQLLGKERTESKAERQIKFEKLKQRLNDKKAE